MSSTFFSILPPDICAIFTLNIPVWYCSECKHFFLDTIYFHRSFDMTHPFYHCPSCRKPPPYHELYIFWNIDKLIYTNENAITLTKQFFNYLE